MSVEFEFETLIENTINSAESIDSSFEEFIEGLRHMYYAIGIRLTDAEDEQQARLNEESNQ